MAPRPVRILHIDMGVSDTSLLALQNGASRDVLLLDIALDNWFRTQVTARAGGVWTRVL